MSLSIGIQAGGSCAGCAWPFDDWEERTRGGHRLAEPTKTEGGTEYVVDVAKKCPRCLSTRVRVTLKIG